MNPQLAPTLAEMPLPAIILLSILAISFAVLLVAFVMVPFFKGLGWLIRHLFAFIGGMLYSLLRIIGGLITSIVFIPLILLNVVIGRWSAASHFGRGLQDEMRTIGVNAYRLFVGHPARLLMLTPLVEGLERRVPDAVAHAPGADKPRKRTGQFDGYKIVGSLKSGGSGSRLYIAEPDEARRAAFARRGFDVDQVVIKVFSLADGSSLPQIVRESKSLEAAKKLGLILDHELTDARFYYVMRYVPGDTLAVVTTRLHDASGPSGLAPQQLGQAVSFASDLVRTLDAYHAGGLWHKDVKPDNIIVSDNRAHLVDFGLVTPLRSAMTLTTHGTEYFRDPEMVRLALKGVKVHEVNGAKFDIYAAGAVLFSIIENGFPAHGGLSQITKKCPEALRWIVRRAMAEYDARYASAREMLEDLAAVQAAADPWAVRPVDLPSMRRGGAQAVAVEAVADDFVGPVAGPAFGPPRDMPAPPPPAAAAAAAGSPIPPRAQPASPGLTRVADALNRAADAVAGLGLAGPADAIRRQADEMRRSPAQLPGKPRLRVVDWWRGGYVVDELGVGPAGVDAPPPTPEERVDIAAARAVRARRHERVPAREQLERARERVRARRSRALERMGRPPLRPVPAPAYGAYSSRPNAGVKSAFIIFFGVVFVGVMFAVNNERGRDRLSVVVHDWTDADVARVDISEVRDTVRQAIAGANQAIREVAAEARAHKAPRVPALPDEACGRWLVVNDLADTLSDKHRATIAAALERIQESGADLAGMGDSDDDVQTLAAARAALGAASRTDDAEAKGRLRDWLESEGDEFVGVLWFARKDDPEKISVAVVARDDIDAQAVVRVLAPRSSRKG